MICLTTILMVFFAGQSNGFIYDAKKDCLLSAWSDWAEVPGLDLHIRERGVMQHENMGGKPCPPDDQLREERSDGILTRSDQQEHLEAIAKSMSKNFIRRKPDPDHPNELSHARDLLIVIDSLVTLNADLFNKTKQSIATLLEMFCPQPNPFSSSYNHAVLIDISNSYVEIFGKNNDDGTAAIKEAILQIPMSSNQSCSAKSLSTAETLITNSKDLRSDSSIDRDVLIVTDGFSRCYDDALVNAFNLRGLSRVFSLLIGSFSSSGLRHVLNYVSTPVEEHMFTVKTSGGFDELLTLLQSQQNSTCNPFVLPKDNKN